MLLHSQSPSPIPYNGNYAENSLWVLAYFTELWYSPVPFYLLGKSVSHMQSSNLCSVTQKWALGLENFLTKRYGAHTACARLTAFPVSCWMSVPLFCLSMYVNGSQAWPQVSVFQTPHRRGQCPAAAVQEGCTQANFPGQLLGASASY